MDRLTYIGHATTLLRLDHASILTDPLLRRGLGPLRRERTQSEPKLPERIDAVLISHLHRDHLDLPSLRRLPKRTPLVVPRGATRWVARAGRRSDPGDRPRRDDLGRRRQGDGGSGSARRASRPLGEGIEPLGYLIEVGGRTVYFAGDTDLFPQMSDLGPLDVALLPVWGWGASVGPGHLDPEAAARALQLLRPRLAVPIHWGTLLSNRSAAAAAEPLVRAPAGVRPLGPQAGPGGGGTSDSAGWRDIPGGPLRLARGVSRNAWAVSADPAALAADRADLLGFAALVPRDRRAELRARCS